MSEGVEKMKSIDKMTYSELLEEIRYVKSKLKTNDLAPKYLFYLHKEYRKRNFKEDGYASGYTNWKMNLKNTKVCTKCQGKCRIEYVKMDKYGGFQQGSSAIGYDVCSLCLGKGTLGKNYDGQWMAHSKIVDGFNWDKLYEEFPMYKCWYADNGRNGILWSILKYDPSLECDTCGKIGSYYMINEMCKVGACIEEVKGWLCTGEDLKHYENGGDGLEYKLIEKTDSESLDDINPCEHCLTRLHDGTINEEELNPARHFSEFQRIPLCDDCFKEYEEMQFQSNINKFRGLEK